MFNNSKYTKWYFQLVESRKTMTRNVFLETHHIIPKCFGGTNDPANLVCLTPREHYICHRLLMNMMNTSDHKRKMAYALIAMGRTNAKGKDNKRISSKKYETIKKICREYFVGKNNPFYGKGHFGKDNPMSVPENYDRFLTAVRSEKHRKKMSEISRGEQNAFFGKTHSPKTRQAISEKRKQPIDVLFENGKREKFSQYGELGIFLGKTPYLGSKLCNRNYSYLWKKYGIKEIIRHDKDS